jgi:hypothetical protein
MSRVACAPFQIFPFAFLLFLPEPLKTATVEARCDLMAILFRLRALAMIDHPLRDFL